MHGRGMDTVRGSTVRRLRDAVRGRGRQARSDTERADTQHADGRMSVVLVCVLVLLWVPRNGVS